jgi:hypothetical protein
MKALLSTLFWAGVVLAGLAAITLAGVALGLLAFLATLSFAHEAPSGWSYPVDCCSGFDCARIPDPAARQVSGGWEFRLSPGDHQFVTEATGPVVIFFPAATVKPSPDGATHACMGLDLTPLCLFVLPGAA